jgi:hypothetical protein
MYRPLPTCRRRNLMESETGEQQRQADIAQTKHCLNGSRLHPRERNQNMVAIVDHAFFLIQRFPSFHLIPTQSSFCSGGPAGCQRPTWILSPASTLSPSAATLAANCVVLPRGAVRANRTEQRGLNSWQESGGYRGGKIAPYTDVRSSSNWLRRMQQRPGLARQAAQRQCLETRH